MFLALALGLAGAAGVGGPQAGDWRGCAARGDVSAGRLAAGVHLRLVARGPNAGLPRAVSLSAEYARWFEIRIRDGRYAPKREAGHDQYTVVTKAPVNSRQLLKARIEQLCGPWRTSAFEMLGLTLESPRQRVAADARAGADARRAEAKGLAREGQRAERWRREEELARLRAYPAVDEVEPLLASDWETRAAETAFSSSSRFIRVNDMTCKRRRGEFLCAVGVIAMDRGRPAYERIELRFLRDPATAKLAVVEPEIIVT